MSRLFGPIRQNGYVVRSLDAAVRHWTEVLGIGPFFIVMHVPLDYYRYRGSTATPDLSIGLAFSGDVQIELIEQHDEAPTPYRDFLRAHGPGLQHVSAWSETYDTDVARLAALGYKPAAEGKIRGSARFVYYETEDHPGSMMEISDLAVTAPLMSVIREASNGWDGRDPRRVITL
jgi:hypothetical protein